MERTSSEVARRDKRKRRESFEELEIDVNRNEPLSKKDLRKLKKKKSGSNSSDRMADPTIKAENKNTKDTKTIGRSEFCVWIGNLSFSTTKSSLRQFFIAKSSELSKVGDISVKILDTDILRINLPKGRDNKIRGFAYVDLSTDELKKTAIKLSESVFEGRRVLIKDAEDFEGSKKVTGDNNSKDQDKAATHILFVGNLPFETVSQDLEDKFTVEYSDNSTDEPKTLVVKPTRVRMASFEDTGKCKGFAFIDYKSIEDASKVLKSLGRRIDVRGRLNCRVEFGEDRSFRHQKQSLDSTENAATDKRKDAYLRDQHKVENSSVAGKLKSKNTSGFKSYKNLKRVTPGQALADRPREITHIVPSQGKKIVFSE
ncbi:hypothetical protein V1511DRAFT_494505 [Dipodascopsis uninucleata]